MMWGWVGLYGRPCVGEYGPFIDRTTLVLTRTTNMSLVPYRLSIRVQYNIWLAYT